MEVNPTDICPFCGRSYGDITEIVQIEAGELVVGRKSGHLVFSPEKRDPAHNWVHLECMLNKMDLTRVPISVFRCAVCNAPTRDQRWVFRIQMGTIDANRLEFVPYQDDANNGYLCTDCVTDAFGGMEATELAMGEYNELQRLGALAGFREGDQQPRRSGPVVPSRSGPDDELVSPRKSLCRS